MTKEDINRAIVTIGKDKLSKLPVADYQGKIYIIDNPQNVDDAVENLKRYKLLGFDTETRPSFKKGQFHDVALIQLATEESCYLFRTNIIGYPKSLITLLEDPEIIKVGLSIHDDFHHLKKVSDFNPQGFIDLQSYVKNFKIADNSLSRVYGILFGDRISKGQRLTNWEASELSESQQRYAALDAYACIKIYEYLNEGKFDPVKSSYLTLPPDPEEITKDNSDS